MEPPAAGMPDKVEDWKDGEKLMAKVRLADNEFCRVFGKDFFWFEQCVCVQLAGLPRILF